MKEGMKEGLTEAEQGGGAEEDGGGQLGLLVAHFSSCKEGGIKVK